MAIGFVGVLGWLGVACGGGVSGANPSEGEGGEGQLEAGAAGKASASGNGQGGDGALDPLAAEAGLDGTDVVLEPAALDGASFVLTTGSLCPTGAWTEPDLYDSSESSLPGVHVRRAASGDLELVSYTGHGGLLSIHVGSMRRAGLGYDVDDVPTCARSLYVFENEYETERYVPPMLHLVFARQADDAPLQLLLGTTDPEGASLQSRGERDLAGPTASHVDVSGTAGIDDIHNDFTQLTFALSEPAAADSELSVVDSAGVPVEIERDTSSGFLVGFRVTDTLSSDARLSVRLFDLARNETTTEAAYPGISLLPLAGDFEGDVDFFTSDIWNDGSGSLECEYVHAGPSPLSELGEGDEPELAALEGQNSFWLGPCSTFFRVLRPPGANRLLFDARAVGAWPYAAPPLVHVTLLSLAAGDPKGIHSSPVDWPADDVLSTPELPISGANTVDLVLPAGDDLLVSISADVHLWLDNLRLE